MIQADQVEALILAAVGNLNDELPDDRKIDVSPSTVLFGVDSDIDSLSLVSIVVDLEAALYDKLGLDIALADERAMDREVLPFTSVQTLKAYILELAGEQ